MSLEIRAALYQQLDPSEPVAADDTARYVDWQAQIGQSDVKLDLVQSVIMGGATHTIRFLTGHRGNGKTSELLRVKQRLEDGRDGRKIFVSFLKSEDWLDLQNVDARDVVYQIVRQLIADLEDRGLNFARDRFKAWWHELGEALSGLHPDKISVGAEPFKFDIGFKESTSLRAEMRKLLDPRLPTLYDLVNGVLADARTELAKPERGGYDDLLVVVDELDRMPRYDVDDAEQKVNRHERLFITEANRLRGFTCDVVYTLPLALAYSTAVKRLQDLYGATVFYLPGIPIFHRDGSRRDDGWSIMRDVLERRAALAGIAIADVFQTPEDLDRLIGASGGYIRSMLILLRMALVKATDGLPLPTRALDQALDESAQVLRFGLYDRDWAVLRRVHDTHQQPSDDESADPFFRLVHDLYIHVYRDHSGYWFDWSPLVGMLDERAS